MRILLSCAYLVFCGFIGAYVGFLLRRKPAQRIPNRSESSTVWRAFPDMPLSKGGIIEPGALSLGGYRAPCVLVPAARPPGHKLERSAKYDSDDNRDFLRGRVTLNPVRPVYKTHWKPPAGTDPKLN